VNPALHALADPFGNPVPPSTSSVAAPGVSPGGGRSGGVSGFKAALRGYLDPTHPLFWFGAAAATTAGLIAISHGHLGGGVSAHVGPVHAEAGVGEE
jgi:hypothetical protein